MKSVLFLIILCCTSSLLATHAYAPCPPAKPLVYYPPLTLKPKLRTSFNIKHSMRPIAQPRIEQANLLDPEETIVDHSPSYAATNGMAVCPPPMRYRASMESEHHDLFMSYPMPQVNPQDPKVYQTFGNYSTWPDR